MKGILLSAPHGEFISAFKILIVVVIIMITIMMMTIAANDGEKNRSHAEDDAGCSPATVPAGGGCGAEASGRALLAADRGAWAQQ